MQRIKSKILSLFIFLSVAAPAFVNAGLCGCDGFGLCAEFLYLSPCISGNHYAVTFDAGDSEYKHRYIDPDWEPAFRVSFGVDNVFRCLDLDFVYTHLDSDRNVSFSTGVQDSVAFSWSTPDLEILGDKASGEWDLKVRSFEFFINTRFGACTDSCFEFLAFSGLHWLFLKEERVDTVTDSFAELVTTDLMDREVEFHGVGPVLGVGYDYTICNGFKWFARFNGCLQIGHADMKDLYKRTSGEVVLIEQTYKSKDKCYCFPGWHLKSGLAYESCVCNWDIRLTAGYEYNEWINAPKFLRYSEGNNGMVAADSQGNITLHGVHLGAGVRF